MAAAVCPITQEIMEDPVVCADGHSYERAAIEKWLQARQTSPCTNAPLPHKNLVPNHALRNLIAEARGVRRPTTVEQHAKVATPCKVEEDDVTGASVPTTAPADEQLRAAREQVRKSVSDDETAAAPEHAAEFSQPIQPCAALCLQQSAASTRRNMPVTKNSLHWAMVEGRTGEQMQLRLLHSDPDLAAQADQGGNLPLHYAASAGVSSAVAVSAPPLPPPPSCSIPLPAALRRSSLDSRAEPNLSRARAGGVCARIHGGLGVAEQDGCAEPRSICPASAALPSCHPADGSPLTGTRPAGHNPIDIATREGNHGLAAVLTGVQNHQRNDLHIAFEGGAENEAAQLRLLECRPELAAQRDPEGNLPLHLGASAGMSVAVLEKCVEVYQEGAKRRNADGFLPHQLALERGHIQVAERLAQLAGKTLPARPINSVLAAARPFDGAMEVEVGAGNDVQKP